MESKQSNRYDGLKKLLSFFLLSFILANSPDASYAFASTFEEPKAFSYATVKPGPEVYRYILTHREKQKLKTPLEFVTGLDLKWTLDLKNGGKIIYTIIYQNIITPMCSVKARDSSGNNCEICITTNGTKAIVEFRYEKETVIYSGYLSK
jgi:hypothetical protein